MAKLKVLFVKAPGQPGSEAIRYLTGEPISHVALRCGDTVVHSHFKGVESITWEECQTRYEVVYSLNVRPQPSSPAASLLEVVGKYDKASYDYLGLIWLGARYLCKRYLGWSIPKVNLWQVSGMFTCTEFVTHVVDGEQDSLVTPYQLYKRLSKK